MVGPTTEKAPFCIVAVRANRTMSTPPPSQRSEGSDYPGRPIRDDRGPADRMGKAQLTLPHQGGDLLTSAFEWQTIVTDDSYGHHWKINCKCHGLLRGLTTVPFSSLDR